MTGQKRDIGVQHRLHRSAQHQILHEELRCRKFTDHIGVNPLTEPSVLEGIPDVSLVEIRPGLEIGECHTDGLRDLGALGLRQTQCLGYRSQRIARKFSSARDMPNVQTIRFGTKP